MLWIFIWVLLPSSFIFVSENVIFHLPKLQLTDQLEIKQYNIFRAREMMTNVDVGYKSAT